MVERSSTAAMLARYRQAADEHGFALVGVVPCCDTDGPEFMYTAGLSRLGLPELICTGLTRRLAVPLLNELAQRLRGGTVLHLGREVEDVLDGYALQIVGVDPSNIGEYLKIAVHLAPAASFLRALQVVWPSADRRWPWEDPALAVEQPLLGPAGGGAWN